MAEFNADKYWEDRINRFQNQKLPENTPQKIQDIVSASQQKIQELEQYRQGLIERNKANEQSWVNQLDLDPESFLGGAVNAAAQFTAGANRAVSEVGAGIHDLRGARQLAGMPQEVIDAWARYKNQQATPEDIQLLSRPAGQLDQADPRTQASDEFIRKVKGEAALEAVKAKRQTNLDRMRAADEAFGDAKAVRTFMDQDAVVHKGVSDELTRDLSNVYDANKAQISQGWERGGLSGAADVVSGVSKLIAGAVSEGLDNKQAVVELVANNLPGLLAAAGGKGAAVISNIPYAVNVFGEAVADYQKKNGGALPSNEELAKMAGWAASAGAAEIVGDKLTLGIKAPVTKLAQEAVETVSKVAGDSVTKGFKEALKGASNAVTKSTLGRMAGAVGEATAGEAVTEGYQTFAENQAKGEETSGEDLYVAASLGGMVGGAVRGSIEVPRALSGAGEKVADTTRKADAARTETAAVKQAKDEAIKSGDISTLLDPQKPTYDPVAGLSAILARTQDASLSEQDRAKEVDTAVKAVETLEQEKTKLEKQLENTSTKTLEAERAELQAVLDNPPEGVTEDVLESFRAGVTSLSQQIEALETDTTAQQRAEKTQARLIQISGQLESANNLLGQIRTAATASPSLTESDISSDLQVLTASDKAPDAAQASASLDRIVTAAMSAVSPVDPTVLAKAADNPLNNLTPEQRNILRVISQAKAAEIALLDDKDVASRIYYGAGKDKGIKQYREAVAKAMKAQNPEAAKQALVGLTKFAKAHASKAKIARAAWNQGKGTQILRTKDGRWFIPKQRQSEALRNLNKGFVVNSERMVEAIEKEAEALRTAETELRLLIEVKSGKSTSEVKENVQNVPSEKEGRKQDQAESKAVQEAEGNRDDEQSPSGSERNQDSQAPAETLKLGKTQEELQEQLNEVVKKLNKVNSDSNPEEVAQWRNQRKVILAELRRVQSEEANASFVKSKVAEKSESTEATQKTPSGAQSNQDTTPQASKTPGGTGLTILRNAKERAAEFAGKTMGEIFRTGNRAVAWVTQHTSPEDLGTPTLEVLPLVDRPDLMTHWLNGEVLPSTFFPSDYQFTEAEESALKHFAAFYKRFAPAVRANFIKGGLPNSKGNAPTEIGLMRDPVQDFLVDGQPDENMVTAVVYGAYAWLSSSVMSPAIKDAENILKMHGLKPEEATIESGFATLSTLAAFQDTAIGNMGKHVLQSLGIQVSKDAPNSYQAMLEAGLGAHAWKAMVDAGVIEPVELSTLALSEMISGFDPVQVSTTQDGQPVYETRKYVRIPVARDPQTRRTEFTGVGKQIKQAVKGSRNVLERFFGSEYTPSRASWEPMPFNQKKAKRSQQGLSEEQTRILKKAQKVPNFIHPEMWELLSKFGDAGRMLILRAAGWKPASEEDLKGVQKALREGIEAQNENLQTQLDNAVELVQDAEKNSPKGLLQGFFHNLEVWQNFRVGITTHDMNLQSSKIHRFMFYRKEWEETLDTSNADQVFAFEVAIAQALGVKIDQKSYQAAVQELYQRLDAKEGRLRKMITALHDARKGKGEISSGLMQDIGEFAASEEGMMTLQAMVEYGNFLAAPEGSKLQVRLLTGADGKTNGPILSFLALGVAENGEKLYEEVNRGGMFSLKDQDRNFNRWYERGGNLDLYQDLMKAIGRFWKPKAPGMKALENITGTLLKGDEVTKDGRKIVKTPLTSFAFGSSVGKSLSNMQAAFVEQIYKQIQALHDGTGKLSREELVQSINVFLPRDRRLSKDITVEQLMEGEFDRYEVKAIKDKFAQLLGKPVQEAMSNRYGRFLARRNAVNGAAQVTFKTYQTIYRALYAAEMERLMDAGEIAFSKSKKTGKRTPYHGMSQNQEAALRKKLEHLLPIAHSAYSKDDNERNAGIYMAKRGLLEGDFGNYPVQVQFGQPIEQTGAGSMTVNLSLRGEKSPGVAALPWSMHAADSAVMHRALDGTEALNVHDEIATSFSKIIGAAQRINAAVFRTFLDYSPATEIYNSMESALVNAAQLYREGAIGNAEMRDIAVAIYDSIPMKDRKGLSLEKALKIQLPILKAAQYEAEGVRLEALSQMASIDQYTWEGGEYQVTDDDRAKAAKLLQDHRMKSKDLPPKAQAALDTLLSALSEEATPKNSREGDELDDVADPASPPRSAFGPLGVSPIRSDEDLVAFFQANPDTTAERVIEGLARKFQGQGFNLKLLAMVKKLVDPKMPIKYITPTTPETAVMKKSPGSRGWLSFNLRGKQEIAVLSPDFLHSGLTPEVLLHELVHAALSRKIALVQVDPTNNADAMALIFELEQLREVVKAADKTGRFMEQTKNLDEFIAWGMTHAPFQAFVKSVQFRSSNWKNQLIDGMRAFIGNLYGLLFDRRQWSKEKVEVNGLAVLVSNVSGLFYQAAQMSNTLDSDTVQTLAMTSPLKDYSTAQIFQALDDGKLTGDFRTQLELLIDGLERKLQGPFGDLRAGFMNSAAATPLDTWTKLLAEGPVPFATETMASPLGASTQESFVIELVHTTMAAALDANEALTKTAYTELSNLYLEAKAKLSAKDFHAGDWAQATPAEQAEAQRKYDFLFDIQENADNRSLYLARFVALGLGHHQVNGLLKFASTKDKKQPTTFVEKLQDFFEQVMDYFSHLVNKTYDGQPADAKLSALMNRLVDIEAKRMQSLEKQQDSTLTLMGESVDRGMERVRNMAVNVLQSPAIKNNSLAVVRLASNLGTLAARNQIDLFMETVKEFRDSQLKNRTLGLAGSLLNEYQGPQKLFQKLLRFSKVLEGQRKRIISSAASLSLEMFANKGKDLKDEDKAAITNVMLRSGAHNLMDRYTLQDIEGFLEDPKKLERAIRNLEKDLDGYGPLKDLYIELANGLGYYKATGNTVTRFLLKNAHNIANLYGTPWQKRAQGYDTRAAEETIKQLVSLYALDYNTQRNKERVLAQLKRENAREGDNGFTFIVQLHKRLEAEALARNFRNNPVLMEHGYLPEITNPHHEIKTIQGSELEAHKLIGYKVVSKLEQEDVDPRKSEKYLVMLEEGGLSPYVTGSISYSSLANKGSTLHNGFLSPNHPAGIENIQDTHQVSQDKFKALAKTAKGQGARRRDLRRDTNKSYLVPLLNERGEVVNYRYEMSGANRDTLLQRDNRFEQLLGASAGAIFDKETSTKQNAKVIGALREQYLSDIKTKADAYVEISPNSPEKRLQEIWAMLPEQTKQEVNRIWGGDVLYVRNDLVDIVFGQRAYSLREIFAKEPKERVWIEKIFVDTIEWGFENYALFNGMSPDKARLYAKSAAVKVAKAERWWMDMVRMIKDIIVVKSVVVLLGNIWSNLSLLKLNGVSFKDIAHHHWVALRGARNHRLDTRALQQAQLRLETGVYEDRKALEQEILRLKDAIARNPVTPFIEEGLMPTIVDDVAMDEDIYSYKASMVKWMDEKTQKLPGVVKEVGKQVAMTHDTEVYKFLSRSTQLSDFVARYTLYQHVTTRKKDRLGHEEAIQKASDSFINYDIPMHRGIQYLDNMGIVPFMKFFMRIQRVLVNLAKEHPMNVLTAVLLNQAVDLGPIVLDSAMVAKIGNNPVRGGAFEIFDAVDELPLVNAAMAVLK